MILVLHNEPKVEITHSTIIKLDSTVGNRTRFHSRKGFYSSRFETFKVR